MSIEKYISTIINVANRFAQSTRPKKIGELSKLMQEYRATTNTPSEKGWEDFYLSKTENDILKTASKKTWDKIKEIRENLDSLTEEDVYEWTKNLVIDKTFQGLSIQAYLLKQEADSAGKSWRLSTTEEEAKGIDGFIGDEAISIKPISYKETHASNVEIIPFRTIFYDPKTNKIRY